MPTVPIYNERQVQVKGFSGLQEESAPAAAFGVGLGNATQRFASDLQYVARNMKRDDDTATAEAGVLALRQHVNTVSFEGDEAYYNLSGKAAMDGYTDYTEGLDEVIREMASNLQPGLQTKLFMSKASAISLQAQQDGSRHAAGERKVYQGQVFDENVATAISDGALRYNNNEQYIEEVTALVRDWGASAGWETGEGSFTEAKIKETLTLMHTGAIDNMLEQGKTGAANDYLEKYGDGGEDQIQTSVLFDLRKKVGDQTELAVAMGVADGLRGSDKNQGERLGVSEALFKSGDLTSTERVKLDDRIKSDWAIEVAAEKKAGDDAWREMYAEMVKNPELLGQDLEADPRWALLSVPQIKSLRRGPSVDRVSVDGMVLKVRGMIARGEKSSTEILDFITVNEQKFSKEHVLILSGEAAAGNAPKPTESDLNALKRLQESMVGKKPGTDALIEIHNDELDIVSGMFETLKKEKTQGRENKELTYDEREEIIDDIGLAIYDKRTEGLARWVDELLGGREITILDVPEDDQDILIEILREQNIPVSNKAILRLFISKGGIHGS
jgi:hypothetical protein